MNRRITMKRYWVVLVIVAASGCASSPARREVRDLVDQGMLPEASTAVEKSLLERPDDR